MACRLRSGAETIISATAQKRTATAAAASAIAAGPSDGQTEKRGKPNENQDAGREYVDPAGCGSGAWDKPLHRDIEKEDPV